MEASDLLVGTCSSGFGAILTPPEEDHLLPIRRKEKPGKATCPLFQTAHKEIV
jgi:hypothetical protein